MNKNIKMPSFGDIVERIYYPYRYVNNNENFNKIQVPDITFQITDNCNLRCSYCYQTIKLNHIMPFEIAKKFIDLLIDNNEQTQQYIDTYSADGVVINFIGGEPFMAIDVMSEIMDYFIKKTIEADHPWQYFYRILITTNGTLYFDPKVQEFIKKHLDHLSMTISIDGNKELHDACRKFPNGEGSYDLAIQAARHFKNYWHGTLGTKMTLSPSNIQYTYDAIKNFIYEGENDIYLNCVYEEGWTIEHAKILYQELKKISDYALENDIADKIYISMYDEDDFKPDDDESFNQNHCGGNGRMLSVDWKGDIFPCLRFMETSLADTQEPVIVGNVNDGFLPNAKCKECVYHLKRVTKKSQSSEMCLNCPISKGCGYCQAYNYQVFGDFDHRTTYICWMHKARALASAYFFNQYYNQYDIKDKIFELLLPDEDCLQIIDEKELQLLKDLYEKRKENIS